MSYYRLEVEQSKLAKTNTYWGETRLNSPWSIGGMSMLIESKKFISKEEWEDFYYSSGEKRLQIIKSIPRKYQEILLDPNRSYEQFKIPKEYRYINYKYGRTKNELNKKAFMFQGYLMAKGITDISMSECSEMVKQRVLKDTWNGIVQREHNTVKVLSRMLPNMDIKPSSSDVDCMYSVDYEVYMDGVLLAGLQIKPISYQDSTKPYIREAMRINSIKNAKYKNKFGVNTYYIYSTISGKIQNKKTVEQIRYLAYKAQNNVSVNC